MPVDVFFIGLRFKVLKIQTFSILRSGVLETGEGKNEHEAKCKLGSCPNVPGPHQLYLKILQSSLKCFSSLLAFLGLQ